MIRSKWKAALAALVAGSGLALGQGHSSAPMPSGKLILLQEDGKPDRKCVILKSTANEDGSLTHQVKVLATGEVLTIHDARGARKAPPPPPAPARPAPAPAVARPAPAPAPAPTPAAAPMPAPVAAPRPAPVP